MNVTNFYVNTFLRTVTPIRQDGPKPPKICSLGQKRRVKPTFETF